ncbi:hypothetical protein LY76DRAFT_341651 [Colletotrichum caudatum]|nr:hypothetical protein LY76DRAFT_341651 [Colletotrichum caudatum]
MTGLVPPDHGLKKRLSWKVCHVWKLGEGRTIGMGDTKRCAAGFSTQDAVAVASGLSQACQEMPAHRRGRRLELADSTTSLGRHCCGGFRPLSRPNSWSSQFVDTILFPAEDPGSNPCHVPLCCPCARRVPIGSQTAGDIALVAGLLQGGCVA